MSPGSSFTLRDRLAIPYRIEARTIETAPGQFVRSACLPELPGCAAESATIEDALAMLERRRIEIIVAMVTSGRAPPVPRQPLPDCDAEGQLRAHGLDDLVPLLDTTPADHRS